MANALLNAPAAILLSPLLQKRRYMWRSAPSVIPFTQVNRSLLTQQEGLRSSIRNITGSNIA